MLDVESFIYYNNAWYENRNTYMNWIYRFEKNQGGGYQ